jgi:hypothetical protein
MDFISDRRWKENTLLKLNFSVISVAKRGFAGGLLSPFQPCKLIEM